LAGNNKKLKIVGFFSIAFFLPVRVSIFQLVFHLFYSRVQCINTPCFEKNNSFEILKEIQLTLITGGVG